MHTLLLVVSGVLLAAAHYTSAVALWGLCDSSNTCTDANTFCQQQSVCQKGNCVCKAGYSVQGSSCVQAVWLGSACTSYCTVGTCTGGTCQCPSGQTASADKMSCVGKNLGGSCNTVADCEGYLEGWGPYVACTNGVCACPTGYKTYDSEHCIWHSDGESCTAGTTQCYPGYASCTNSKCTCSTINGVTLVWRDIYQAGQTMGACVHPSSQQVGYGQSCTQVSLTDATSRYCGAGLVCGSCPENVNTNNYVCLNGASQQHVNLVVMLAVLGVALLASALLN